MILLLMKLEETFDAVDAKKLLEYVTQDEFDAKLLQKQIEFLETANSSISSSFTAIAKSFDSFVGAINIFFAIALVIITITGSVAAFLGVRSISVLVKQEVEHSISQNIEERIGYLKKLIDQQAVLSRVNVTYIVPGVDVSPTDEFLMLKHRIKNTLFSTSQVNGYLKTSNVVVLDLVSSNLDDSEEGKTIATDIARTLPRWSALVLYTPTNRSPVFEHLNYLKTQGESIVDFATANMKITLMDRVIGASYASDALKS